MKRLNLYEIIIVINLILNIIFYVINEDFLKYKIPIDIMQCSLCISLGLYLGFQLFKYESKRVWKLQDEEEKRKTKKMPPGHSPN